MLIAMRNANKISQVSRNSALWLKRNLLVQIPTCLMSLTPSKPLETPHSNSADVFQNYPQSPMKFTPPPPLNETAIEEK